MSHRILLAVATVVVGFTLLNTTCRADTSDLPDLGTGSRQRDFGSQLWYDTRYVVTAPARWNSDDWKSFALATAGVLATAALVDQREADSEEDAKNDLDKLATNAEPFGASYSVYTLAGFYLGGKIFDSPRAKAVAEDGFDASIITSVIVTPVIKAVVGRQRPSNTSDKGKFRPFSSAYSFPSGHTAQAFTLASVIAAHYDSVWIDTAAYSTATLVGYARHQHMAHWESDIVAGALIGMAIGRTVVRLNNKNRGTLSVTLSDSGPMLSLSIPLH